jgi:hypothetical protein
LLEVGASFLIPSGPGDFLHLFVVCSSEKQLPDMRILVPISSIKSGVFFDPSCLVDVGEHDFIRMKSYAHYKHIQQRSSSKIISCLESGAYVSKGAVSQSLLAKLITGMLTSDFTEPWVYDLLD